MGAGAKNGGHRIQEDGLDRRARRGYRSRRVVWRLDRAARLASERPAHFHRYASRRPSRQLRLCRRANAGARRARRARPSLHSGHDRRAADAPGAFVADDGHVSGLPRRPRQRRLLPRRRPDDAGARRCSARGYRTGGFVAAFVLDGRWGINQGFDRYFDDFDLAKYKARRRARRGAAARDARS